MRWITMPDSPRWKHFFKFWMPVYIYAAFIFYQSSLSSLPFGASCFLDFFCADKLIHLAEYAILSCLIARAVKNSARKDLKRHFRIWAVTAALFYGITDEWHQHFISGRHVEFFDVVADGIGAYLGQFFITH
ncbi:MAG: VanZ family protein [Candidatus Omnitrophota bacterium]